MAAEVDAESDMRLCVHNGLVALQLRPKPKAESRPAAGGGRPGQLDAAVRHPRRAKSSSELEVDARIGMVQISTSSVCVAGGEAGGGGGALTPLERARDDAFFSAWVRSLFVSRGRRGEGRRGADASAGASVGGAGFSDDGDDDDDSQAEEEAEEEAASAAAQIAAPGGAVEPKVVEAAVGAAADAPAPLLPPRITVDVEDAADRRVIALCKSPVWRASLLRHWNLQRSESQVRAHSFFLLSVSFGSIHQVLSILSCLLRHALERRRPSRTSAATSASSASCRRFSTRARCRATPRARRS